MVRNQAAANSPQSNRTLVDSVLGCIVGGAIGDAAGSAAEGLPTFPMGAPVSAGEWRLTDDTQLTLATCEALTECASADPAAIAAALLRWFRGRRLTGLGASTLKALRDLDAGTHWALAGRKGDRGAGNGAAMRIAPLAFCVDPATDEGYRVLREVCRITHHHDEAHVGALAVVWAIHGALRPGWSLEEIADRLPDTSVRDRLLAYVTLPAGVSLAEAGGRFGVSGYVVESVPFALYAARRVSEIGFAGMLEQVIAAGGDTDTNASLAGQVAGASLGFAALPDELMRRLPQAEMVLGIARAFAKRVADHVRPGNP
jgi:ADP-ribosylglycohydrolase